MYVIFTLFLTSINGLALPSPLSLKLRSYAKVRSYALTIGEAWIEWVKHTRLLSVPFDDRLSWAPHLKDLKKNFCESLEAEMPYWTCTLK